MAILNNLRGSERDSMSPSQTQVYQVTHDGDQYLPFMNRSFISFSYGGKNIEDFNLIATIDGNRMQRNAYSSFDDLTTIYDALNGQFYWGTYYHTNNLNLTLSTDGMTEVELDNFKHWFMGGESKELILSEHPNRAIMARISDPPALRLLPFEKRVNIQIQDRTYTTSTTLYKGEIILNFVMDEPFWYAKQNILGNQNVLQGYYSEEWVDANGKVVEVRDNQDALKIIYEDHIPLGSTTNVSVFLGGNVFATVISKIYSQIVAPISEEEYEEGHNSSDQEYSKAFYNNGNVSEGGEYYFPATNENGYYQFYSGAVIATLKNDGEEYESGGRIDGAELSTMGENDSGATLSNTDIANLYYAGTAPSPLKIKFQLTPLFDGERMIISPANKYSNPSEPYNTITFKATKIHKFKFTTPGIYNSYNQVLQIFDQFIQPQAAWLTIREYIRDLVKHPIVRAWANCVINQYDTKTGSGYIATDINKDALIAELKYGMQALFYNKGMSHPLEARFEFDGKTGKATGTFKVRNPKLVDTVDLTQQAPWSSVAADEENLLTLVEDVGDMVKSSYLILDERNVLNDSYQVQSWSADHPDYSYEIEHNLSTSLEHLQFEFKNLYL